MLLWRRVFFDFGRHDDLELRWCVLWQYVAIQHCCVADSSAESAMTRSMEIGSSQLRFQRVDEQSSNSVLSLDQWVWLRVLGVNTRRLRSELVAQRKVHSIGESAPKARLRAKTLAAGTIHASRPSMAVRLSVALSRRVDATSARVAAAANRECSLFESIHSTQQAADCAVTTRHSLVHRSSRNHASQCCASRRRIKTTTRDETFDKQITSSQSSAVASQRIETTSNASEFKWRCIIIVICIFSRTTQCTGDSRGRNITRSSDCVAFATTISSTCESSNEYK